MRDTQPPLVSAERVRELTELWVQHMVIGLNLCPFAKPALERQGLRIRVSQAKHLDGFLDDLDEELGYFKGDSNSEVETTLLVHPQLFPDFLVFNDLLNVVDDVIEEHGLEDEVEVVAFHPELTFEGADADSLENLPNRSPFPMLHLLRTSSLHQASPNGDTAHIVERNRETIEALGAAGWEARWQALSKLV